MKNLFKKLMLVAVAAMAFTACSQDVNEVNKVEKKTVISGVLNIENEDTRSGFTGSYTEGDKTFYQSKWDGGETIKIYIDGYGSVFTTVNAEGRFEAVIDGEVSPSTSMTVCSPADAWDSQWQPTIASEQTPRANSVDPAVHVLQSASATISSSSITMSPQCACYGKMTVNVPDDFVIDYVDIQLRGLEYFSYENTISYTLQADHVENNTFWFAIPSTYDVSEFTVTAYDAGKNAVTKTVTIPEDRELKFNWGHVSTFSVSNLEAVVAPDPEPSVKTFTSAEVSTVYDLNDYEICFKDQEGKEFYVEFYYGDGTYVIENDILKEGTYVLDEFDGSNGLYYVDYDGIGFSCATVIVSHVEGLYNIQFTNLKKWNWNSGAWTDVPFEEAVYTGGIIGLSNPDGSAPTPEPDPTPDPKPGVADGLTYDTAYTFTDCVLGKDSWGYPVLTFSGSENNAELYLAGNYTSYFKTGLQAIENYASPAWYTSDCWYKIDGQIKVMNASESYTYFDKNASGYIVDYIYIKTTDGTSLYYKYEGTIVF